MITKSSKKEKKDKRDKNERKEVESQKDDNMKIDMESLRLNNPFAKKIENKLRIKILWRSQS